MYSQSILYYFLAYDYQQKCHLRTFLSALSPDLEQYLNNGTAD